MTKTLGFFTPVQDDNKPIHTSHGTKVDSIQKENGNDSNSHSVEKSHNLIPTFQPIEKDTQFLNDSLSSHFTQVPVEELIQKLYGYLSIGSTEYESLLEKHYYLEKVLLPSYSSSKSEPSSKEHSLSLIILLNVKVRQKLSVWHLFETESAKLVILFATACRLALEKELDFGMKSELVSFLTTCFASFDHPVLRSECSRLVNVGILEYLHSESARERIFESSIDIQESWNRFQSRLESVEKQSTRDRIAFEQSFLSQLMISLVQVLSLPCLDPKVLLFCKRIVSFFVDLESRLTTRRYFHLLLQDHLVIMYGKQSSSYREGHEAILKKNLDNPHVCFAQFMDMLDIYAHFEMDEGTGTMLSKTESVSLQYKRIKELQKHCFIHFKDELLDFSLSNVGKVHLSQSLSSLLSKASEKTLEKICKHFAIRTLRLGTKKRCDKEWLVYSLVYHFQSRKDVFETILKHPLFLNETFILDKSRVPFSKTYLPNPSLSIPKLSLQYISLQDYLYRNYFLCRYEAAFSFKEDVMDAALRLAPTFNGAFKAEHTVFKGTCRMALPIEKFEMVQVGETRLGDARPLLVKAHVFFSLQKYTAEISQEWDSLRSGDTLYLVSFKASDTSVSSSDLETKVGKQFGLKSIRGCTVAHFMDHNGNPIEEPYFHSSQKVDRSTGALSTDRTLAVLLDPEQYHLDHGSKTPKKRDLEDMSSTFNVLLRRDSKSDLYVTILDSLRDLMREDVILPDWLHDVFLGYGENTTLTDGTTVEFYDTFLDMEHVKTSFPDWNVVESCKEIVPPFKLEFPPKFWEGPSQEEPDKTPLTGKKRKRKTSDVGKPPKQQDRMSIHVYASSCPTRLSSNRVPYTPIQVKAIHSGMKEGLCLISGSQGSGKTTLTAQIIANLVSAHPEQRVLVVAPTVNGIEKLFEKLRDKNVDETLLLYLGQGSSSDGPFGCEGRINALLEKRLHLLNQVDRLAKSLNVPGDHGSNCQTAIYFFESIVEPRWKSFKESVGDIQNLEKEFPFKDFFSDFSLSENADASQSLEMASQYYSKLMELLQTIKQVRGVELFRSDQSRSEYLMSFQAKIIGINSFFISSHRKKLLELGFTYDTVIFYDAQALHEVQTFLSLTLQPFSKDTGKNLLKRVIMVGNKDGLPVFVENPVLEQYSHFNQTMYTRMIRQGIPVIELQGQGLYRPSLYSLFESKPVEHFLDLNKANPGFCFEFQFLNVQDYMGQGESEPRPLFYQNLGEAEYAVALFQYMRLVGIPGDRITLLASYNGQVELILDVLDKRCHWHPFFGSPKRVTTLDKYAQETNDFVIVSLVRTVEPGIPLRDVNRIVTCLSRGRFGCYILGRKSVFDACAEWDPFMSKLSAHPTDHLWIVNDETFQNVERHVESTGLSYSKKSNKWSLMKNSNVRGIANVQEMGSLVMELTNKRLESLKSRMQL